MSESELRQLHFDQDLALLDEYWLNSTMTQDEYLKQQAALQKKHFGGQHKELMGFIQARYKVNVAGWTAEQNAMASAFSQMLGMGAQYSKTVFKLNKAAGIGKAIMSTFTGAAKALEWGWPLGPVFAASIVATGLAQVAQIKAQSFQGQADAGMDFVPYAGTYLLSKGERVVAPEQNKDLTAALNGEGVGNGNITIENIQIDVLPNATNADSLLNLSELEWQELVAEKIISSLNRLYTQGIYPVYAEQEA